MCQGVVIANETHKKCVKSQYDKSVQPRVFGEDYLTMVYDQDHDKLGVGKLEPLWHGHYTVKHVL